MAAGKDEISTTIAWQQSLVLGGASATRRMPLPSSTRSLTVRWGSGFVLIPVRRSRRPLSLLHLLRLLRVFLLQLLRLLLVPLLHLLLFFLVGLLFGHLLMFLLLLLLELLQVLLLLC